VESGYDEGDWSAAQPDDELIRYLARRLIFAFLLVFVVSSAALLLTRAAPGDLTAQIALTATPEEIARTRARFGLDRSVAAQWADWMVRAARFDFGESFLYNRPVTELIARAAANTAALAVVALVLATALGIPLGIVAGSRRGGAITALVRGASILCLSVPPLLTSLLFVWLASRTGWLPVGGMTSAGASELGWAGWLDDLARHLPLPAVALALPIAATLERLQAQSIGETVGEPFVLAALARGLSRGDLVLRHAWRVSLRPVCALYGIVIGALLSGSFAVEYVTSWPGLGRLMYDALRARDLYLVAGCAAAGAVFLAFGSLVSDLLLALADPRTRDAEAP
jgi:peptide/nickel transport system permease protein